MIYLFFLFFFISPFIYLQICPLCKKRPQNMLYLTGGYVMIMIFSLFYPDWIKGERLFLYLYLAVLSLEGVLILSWRMKKSEDDYLVSVYARARTVMSGLLVVLLFFILFQNFPAFSDPQCPDMIILKLPGQDKVVQIEASGFVLEEKLIASEGDRTRFLASHGKTGIGNVILTFTILTNDRESTDINEAFWIIFRAQQKSKEGEADEYHLQGMGEKLSPSSEDFNIINSKSEYRNPKWFDRFTINILSEVEGQILNSNDQK